MRWSDVVADPNLRDLPYKIELNEYGQIVMTPHKVYHSAIQEAIADELKRQLPGGRTPPEFPIRTSKGTKSADVVWCSRERFVQIRQSGENEALIAPEICVEVLADSNTEEEMKEKRALYFEAGAKEFWLSSKNAEMRFFTQEGEIPHSILAPYFPKIVDY